MVSIELAIPLTTHERVFFPRRSTIASTLPVFVAVIATIFTVTLGTTAHATTITVDSPEDTGAPGICVLRDAITAANTMSEANGCSAGTGNDTIIFSFSGTIFLASALPAIVGNLTIIGPTSGPRGGGTPGIVINGNSSHQIMLVDSGAALTLQFLTLAHGAANGLDGGAVFNSGTLAVTNSTFTNNTARPSCILFKCVGGEGGAISSSGTAIITNSSFNENASALGSAPCSGGDGGAISNSGTLSVTRSTFSGNSTSVNSQCGHGGAISNSRMVSVTNSTFSGNFAKLGGAIFNSGLTTATPALVTFSTFSGNSAATAGGAVFGSSSVKNSILAASTGGNCSTPLPTDAGYNISDDSSCGFAKTGSANNGDNVDPLLSTSGLANNGGPTQTIALQAGSPAIDAIPIADCTDQSSPPQQITTDQRGFPRPDARGEAFCDIGAYESAY